MPLPEGLTPIKQMPAGLTPLQKLPAGLTPIKQLPEGLTPLGEKPATAENPYVTELKDYLGGFSGFIKALPTTVSQLPGAAAEVVKTPFRAITSPVQTAKGVYAGGAQWTKDFLTKWGNVIDNDMISKQLKMAWVVPNKYRINAGPAIKELGEAIPDVQAPENQAGKTAAQITKAGLGIAEIVALSKTGLGAVGAMATLGAVEEMAKKDNTPAKIAHGAASGATLGVAFKGLAVLPKLLSLPANAVVFGGMTAQGLAEQRGGLDKLTEEDKDQIVIDALIGFGLAIPGKAMTVRQLTDKLTRKGFDKAIIDKVANEYEGVAGDPNLRNEVFKILNSETATPTEKSVVAEGIKLDPRFADLLEMDSANIIKSKRISLEEVIKKAVDERLAVEKAANETLAYEPTAAGKEETQAPPPTATAPATAEPPAVVSKPTPVEQVEKASLSVDAEVKLMNKFERKIKLKSDKWTDQDWQEFDKFKLGDVSAGKAAAKAPVTDVISPVLSNEPGSFNKFPETVERLRKKSVSELSKEEFNILADVGFGKDYHNAAMTDDGRVVISNLDHGDLIPKLKDQGLISEDVSKPQYRGWVWGKDKSTFIDISDLQRADGDFYEAFKGKISAAKEVTDINAKLAELKTRGADRRTDGATSFPYPGEERRWQNDRRLLQEIFPGQLAKEMPTIDTRPAEAGSPTGQSPVEAAIRAKQAEVPQAPSKFIAPKPFETPRLTPSETRKLETILDQLDVSKSEIMAEVEAGKTKAEDAKPQIDEIERFEKSVERDLLEARKQDIIDLDPEFVDLLRDTEAEARAADALKDTSALDVSKETPAEIGKAAQEVHEAAKTNPIDVRKDTTPAYRVMDTGEIIQGGTYAEAAAAAKLKGHDFLEEGFMDKDKFVANWTLKKGAEDPVLLKERRGGLGGMVDFLSNERGAIGENSTHLLSTEALAKVRELQMEYKKLYALAKNSGKTLDQYMRDKGASEDAIHHTKRILDMQVQTKEVLRQATSFQKKDIEFFAKELNVSLTDVIKKLGYENVRLYGKLKPGERRLTADEAYNIRTYLTNETADVSVSNMEEIKQHFDHEQVPSKLDLLRDKAGILGKSGQAINNMADLTSEYIMSPDKVFSRSPEGARAWDATMRANQKKLRIWAYIMKGDELNLEKRISGVKKGSEADTRVGYALENKIDLTQLSPKERQAYEALKSGYAYQYKYALEHFVPDPGRRLAVEKIAELARQAKTEQDPAWAQKLPALIDELNLTKMEKQGLQLAINKVEYYMTHIHDREGLAQVLRDKILEAETKHMQSPEAIEHWKDLLSRLEGGDLIHPAGIPKSISMEYYKRRAGITGYKQSALNAFEIYSHAWLKKIFDEPALQTFEREFRRMDTDMKKYASWYIRQYMGWDKPYSNIANNIKSYMWFRTLAFNLAAPFTNLTQMANTFGETGVLNTVKGMKRALTAEGRNEFAQSGIPGEISGLYIETDPSLFRTGLDKAKYIGGYLFNAAEYANRAVAFHAGMYEAHERGLLGEDAYWHAVNNVHKTQFIYGKVGMPMITRGGAGVITQYSSFTIKQIEMLGGWVKEFKAASDKVPADMDAKASMSLRKEFPGAMKLLTYLAISYGMKEALYNQGVNVNNALGTGIDPSEVLQAIQAMSDQDIENMIKHLKLAKATEGSGIFPSSFPLLTGPVLGTYDAIKANDKGLSDFVASVTPLSFANKLRDFIVAVREGDREKNEYPIYKFDAPDMFTGSPERLKYKLGFSTLLLRTFGPASAVENELRMKALKHSLVREQSQRVKSGFVQAVLDLDSKKVNRLARQYGATIANEDVKAAIERELTQKNLTDEQRWYLQKNLGELETLMQK
jgi:hypothetical protein